MQAANHSAINAYNQIGVETSVSFASPHQLILLLYDGALSSIAEAKTHILSKQVARKGEMISKAIAIIDEGLKASLDEHAGDGIAKNLKALYEYMCHRLLMANIQNNVEALDEVTKLLLELKTAWESIGKKDVSLQPEPTHMQQRVAASYGKI